MATTENTSDLVNFHGWSADGSDTLNWKKENFFLFSIIVLLYLLNKMCKMI